MPTIVETLTSIALDPAVISGLQTDLRGVTGRVPGAPTAEIGQITALVGQIALPDQRALFGDGAARLQSLVRGGLRAPETLWAPLTNPLGGLESAFGGGLQAPMDGAFASLRAITTALPADPSALLGGLAVPLQEAARSLGQSPELQRVTGFIGTINDLRAQLEAAPTALATLFADQIQGVIADTTAPLQPELRQFERFLTALDGQLPLAAWTSRYATIQEYLTPAGGPSLAAAIAALDFSAEAAVAPVAASLSAARFRLEEWGRDLELGFGQAASFLPTFDLASWGQRLAAAAVVAGSSSVNDLASILARWQDGLVQARAFIENLSLTRALQPLRDLIARLQPLLGGFNLKGVKAALLTGIQTVSGLVDAVRQAQIDVLANLQSLANTIAGAIDAIDLSLVTNTIDNALGALDPVLTQIEGGVDTIFGQLQGALGSLQSELATLHASLTDPDGAVRRPIEEFLNSIRDAIPDGIPDRLNEIGQLIADTVASLDEIALDPVFDTVVGELEDMRQQLQEIDVASLNALLQAALAAAIEVFRAFDFPGEVEEFLISKFDEAVADVAEPAIQLLQDQVDGIFAFLRANDPAALFDSLGVTQAYDEMVAQLDRFRPSEALRPIAAEVRRVADQLDGFTPSRVLAPIVEPLMQLRQFVQSLSLDPLFAQLQGALDRLTGLLDQLDIAPFVAQLNEAIGGVRARLNALLTIDGLLDFLRPIHSAAMDGLHALDPAVLLQPLTDVRQTLLNAIDAVPAGELGDAFAAIARSVDRLGLPGLRADLQERVRALADGLAALDLPGKLAALRNEQQAIRNALLARGVQPDPDAEARRQSLLRTAEALDPLPILASALAGARPAQEAVSALAQGLENLLRDGGPLQQPLQALSAKLRELALGITEGAADLKQALRGAVTRAYETMGVDTIQVIYRQVEETFQSFSPENLEATLNELLAPVRDLLDALLDPSALFQEVVDAYNGLRGLIDPGLADFLNQVRSDVQPILDAVTSKLNALDPAAIIDQLDARYADLMALKDRLLGKLQEALDGLDAPYQQVVELIDALNPGTVLVEPLNAAYQAILDKLEGIDIRAVFQPLLDALRGLRDQLVAGIERTATAFTSFVSAAPSVSATASIGLG